MEVFLLWVGLAAAVGFAATKKGRSGFGWFVLACVISPLLGAIFLALPSNLGVAALQRDELGQPISPDSHVRCPECRELVRNDARKCKHCGTALIPLVE